MSQASARSSRSRGWQSYPSWGGSRTGRIAALVGVAPLNRESGTLRGRRAVGGGRRAVRTALYLGTLRATRCHPAIPPCSERLLRLLAAGKAKKVALVACMRKVLTILNAMRKHQTPWQAQAA